MLREPTAGSGKPRRGHEKHCPAAGIEATKKTRAGGTEPGPPARTKRKWKCSEAFSRGCPASATPGRCPPAWLRRWGPRPAANAGGLRARVVVLEGHERAHQSELGFEQQNRFRNSREIQRIEKKAFRARADAAQSARQGGTEPGTTRFRDGRRTAGPPAPRRGPGAPAAQPRPRGPDLESAQI